MNSNVRLPESTITLEPTTPAERHSILQARKVNLNTADTGALQSLPGVGPKTARAILRYRRRRGPFRTVQQLERVKGIGPATLRKLAPKIKIENGLAGPVAARGEAINVNQASGKRLQELPGVGPVTAASIVKYREREGPFRDLDELRSVPGIGSRTLESLRSELTVGSAP